MSAAAEPRTSYAHDPEKLRLLSEREPSVSIFLRPIAPPAALGLAGYAGSTWIVSPWIAAWWGSETSPGAFFPFVLFWGGLAQFLAGLYGFPARDSLVTIVHTLWGSFYLSLGLFFFLESIGTIPTESVYLHTPALGAWMIVLLAFTWVATLASLARDFVLFLVLFFLSVGSSIAAGGWYVGDTGDFHRPTIKAAAYFWIFSSMAAWWRVTVFLLEEAYGSEGGASRFYPAFVTPFAKTRPLIAPGFGEPGVRRAQPGLV